MLTNFALVGQPDIVLRLWLDTAYTTPAVQSEYQAGAAAGLVPGETWADLPMVVLTEAEATFATELPPRSGTSERTCLAVAVHRHGLLVSDDQDARAAACRYGVPVTDTLSILLS